MLGVVLLNCIRGFQNIPFCPFFIIKLIPILVYPAQSIFPKFLDKTEMCWSGWPILNIDSVNLKQLHTEILFLIRNVVLLKNLISITNFSYKSREKKTTNSDKQSIKSRVSENNWSFAFEYECRPNHNTPSALHTVGKTQLLLYRVMPIIIRWPIRTFQINIFSTEKATLSYFLSQGKSDLAQLKRFDICCSVKHGSVHKLAITEPKIYVKFSSKRPAWNTEFHNCLDLGTRYDGITVT